MNLGIRAFTDKPEATLAGLNSQFGVTLQEWLAKVESDLNVAIRTQDAVVELHRIQGALTVISCLRNLKSSVLQVQKDLGKTVATKPKEAA